MRLIAQPRDSTTQEQPQAARTESDARFGVIAFGHRDARVRWLREGDSIVVGRAFPADLMLEDQALSRQHARLSAERESLLLTDLGSRNGVWLRGSRVVEARLRAGDSVQLGSVTLLVRGPQAANVASFEELMSDARSFIANGGTHRSLALVVLCCADAQRALVLSKLRTSDCAAVYGPGLLALELKDTDEAQARAWLAELPQALRAGVAIHPEVATRHDAPLAAARAALDRTSALAPLMFASPAHRSADGEQAGSPAGESVQHGERMRRVQALARRAARSELPVLVLGETGSGKEVLAREIHGASPRAGRAFRIVNCGGLPASLLESVLFGHEKGAFTGATKTQAGLFEQADGGTLLLDEVGELSLSAQAALLRVLENKTLTRLGSASERKVDVRVLAATHRDLPALCGERRFREDLLHRLNAITLVLPPLRERPEEVAAFVERFLRGAGLPQDSARAISPEALAKLCAYRWPGNVRQLKNVIERAAVLALGAVIDVEDLPEEVRSPAVPAPVPRAPATPPSARASARTAPPPAPEPMDSALPLRARMQQQEADLIRRALARAEGNRTRAAQLLRMPLRTFMKRIKEYGID